MNDEERLPPDPTTDDDLGPEPDWLADAEDDAPAAAPPPPRQEPKAAPTTAAKAAERPAEGRRASGITRNSDRTERVEAPASVPIEAQAVAISSEPVPEPAQARQHPWMFAALPAIFLAATAIIAWFATQQTLNDVATWTSLHLQDAPLLPARWSLFMWWVVLSLLAVFLIYAALPRGRDVSRIKLTGPLVTLGLIGSVVWLFAQHWQWETAAVAGGIGAVLAAGIAYAMVAISKRATNLWQRLLAILPLSVGLGYSVILAVLAWQQYSSQPFGERGTSVLVLFIAVLLSAIIAFFLHDGAFAMVMTIWFLGVAQRQWGQDAVISLGSIVAVIFCVALAAMGMILALDSHRPAFTTEVPAKRGRISFRRRTQNSPEETLPQ